MLKTFNMVEVNARGTDILQIGILAVGVYAVYKISQFGSGIKDTFNNTTEKITDVSREVYNYEREKINNYIQDTTKGPIEKTTFFIPTIQPGPTKNISKGVDLLFRNGINATAQNFNNEVTSLVTNTPSKVKSSGGSSYSFGTLKVQGQGYSVNSNNAQAMTQKIVGNAQQQLAKNQKVYTQITVNPYSKIK